MRYKGTISLPSMLIFHRYKKKRSTDIPLYTSTSNQTQCRPPTSTLTKQDAKANGKKGQKKAEAEYQDDGKEAEDDGGAEEEEEEEAQAGDKRGKGSKQQQQKEPQQQQKKHKTRKRASASSDVMPESIVAAFSIVEAEDRERRAVQSLSMLMFWRMDGSELGHAVTGLIRVGSKNIRDMR